MEFEKEFIIDELSRWLKEHILHLDNFSSHSGEVTFDKNSEESEKMRVKGNELFLRKKHDKRIHEGIWMFYSKSIALALNDSEQLAAAYANRSAFLLHLKKYQECLLDIERALKITKSNSLKVKLFCRQTECYVYLHEGNASSSLTKAKHWFQKVDNNSCDVEKLRGTIDKTENAVKDNIPDLKKKEKVTNIPYSKDFVDVRYSKKYGKHLFATKDIHPGEFIYAEKFYVTSVNSSKNYAYCSHCLAISWTLIPCDQCSFYMFCSQKCKSEAWKQYHDMEYSVKFPYKSSNHIHYFVQLSIKLLIMGIKETGSIKKLKDFVLKYIDPKDEEFPGNMKSSWNSFQNLMSLTPSKSKEKLDMCVTEAIRALIKLIGNAGILQSNLKISDYLEDLIQDDDVIFTGTLLLRLMSISFINARNTLHITEACKGATGYGKCRNKFCCSRGMYLSLSNSMIHHNCNNNVTKICSNDGRVMYYASKPINKNEQITVSYCLNFTVSNKANRQGLLRHLFEFDCVCIACQENWPIIDTMLLTTSPKTDLSEIEFAIFRKHEKKIEKVFDNPNYRPSKKTLKDIAEDTRILFEITISHEAQPKLAAYFFSYILSKMMENTYCQKLCIQDNCK